MGGAGRHVEAVILFNGPNMVMTRSKIDKGVEVVLFTALTAPKLSILVLYMRIFSTKGYRNVTYAVGSLVIATCLGAFIMSATICRPIAYQWDHSIPGGRCADLMAAYTWVSVPNITSDLIMLVLPLPALYSLRIGMAAKTGLFFTFLTASA
jgi:hypothetical protein